MKKEIIVQLNRTFEESAYAQNGDPRKEQIAFAQSYFAIQARRQELLEERIALVERVRAREKLADTESELTGVAYERGVASGGRY